MTPKVIQQPTEEPISVAEARAHCEAPSYADSDSDGMDDVMFEGWISAAREHCENFLGLSLAEKTLEIALHKFPMTRLDGRTWVELPMGPVTGIEYVIAGDASSDDSDGQADLPEDDYVLDDFSVPNRVVPVVGWPTVSGTNAVRIRYTAGYAFDSDGNSNMPKAIRAAMLLVIGHLYANREDSAEKALTSIPNGAEALMRPLRIRLGMA